MNDVTLAGDAGSLLLSLDAAKAAAAVVGAGRIEVVTATSNGRVTIQPTRLDDGEDIARALGLGSPMDHRMLFPEYTMWSGTRDGLEFQVRAALRAPYGARP